MVIAPLDFTVLRDAWKIRTNSFASVNKLSKRFLFITPASMSNSNQYAVSSASSIVIPIFEMKSARDLARHALR